MGEPREGSPSGEREHHGAGGQAQNTAENAGPKRTRERKKCAVLDLAKGSDRLWVKFVDTGAMVGMCAPSPRRRQEKGAPEGSRGLHRAREGFPDRQGCTRPAPLWAGLEKRWSPIRPNASHGRGLKALEGPLASPESPHAAVGGGE